jgi:hypothetical protein
MGKLGLSHLKLVTVHSLGPTRSDGGRGWGCEGGRGWWGLGMGRGEARSTKSIPKIVVFTMSIFINFLCLG